MDRLLTKREELYHYKNGKKIIGKNNDMKGYCDNLTGDCTGLSGNCNGLRGNCTGLTGNCDGLSGDLDACNITQQEKDDGVVMDDLIASRE